MKQLVNRAFIVLGSFLGLLLILLLLSFFSLPRAPIDTPSPIKVEHLISHPKNYLNEFVRFENAEAQECQFVLSRSRFKVKSSESSAIIPAYSDQFYQNGEVLDGRVFLVVPINCNSENGCKILLKEARI